MNKTKRLLHILDKLSSQKKVCVKELAIACGVTKRTIQDDLDFMRENFPNKLNRVDADCYALLKKFYFHDLFQHNHKTSKEFLKVLSIIDSELHEKFREEHKDLIKALKLSSSAIYQIENSPYEKLKETSLELLEELESAIINQTYLTITHHQPNKKEYIFYECQALKIIYLEENWYLALNTLQNYHKNNPNNCFRIMRISFITKIALRKNEPLTFHHDNIERLKAIPFLSNFQTPFSKVYMTPYRVTVKASAYASIYFKAKRYLKTQRIIETFENGDSLIEFMITDDMEIMPLIQQWIPHLKIIEPLRIRDTIVKKMEDFMKEG